MDDTEPSTVMLPTGTVTFLFSDIEGSTHRWEQHRDAMHSAVVRHEALVRSAVAENNGYIFKTVGDAFCCAFSSPINAVRAALAAQEALDQEDFSNVDGLRVRIGIHTGHAHEREGDYFGPAVNRVARLMSIGHGGQVLLSAATRELVQDDLPDNITLTDLGLQQLKDLTHPEHVWQVSNASGAVEFPQLRSLDAYPNNLPLQVTTFYGRERDLDEIKQHVGEHRLVTIAGPGGVGKTRLAVQAGADVLERFRDGVWIADFARITDADSVSSIAARAVGVDQGRGMLSHESIAQWLRHKQLLFILDDCEHVLQATAQLADVIQRTCPDVRILATSRQALAVSGEKVLRLESLAVPQQSAGLTHATALQSEAVALFVDRASLVDQTFRVDDRNAAVVADICRRLDGIPLAIELAAARVKTLSLTSLAQRLDERFKILTKGSRTAMPRQQTLAALIDWSYDLLDEHERKLFNRLSIFAGSFTLAAASNVCAFDGIDDVDILDLLSSLADKSLVAVDLGDDGERYRMLESTRQYAADKLSAVSEFTMLARRWADYYVAFAQEAQRNIDTIQLSLWLVLMERELRNFRAVLEWSLRKDGERLLGATLAAAMEMFWWHGGLEAEGIRWIRLAFSCIDATEHPDIAERLTQVHALLTSRMLFS